MSLERKYITQQISRLPIPFFRLFYPFFCAFHPPVIKSPAASECISTYQLQHSHCIRKHLSNSLQHSYCARKHSSNRLQHSHYIRKHFVQQSTTFPLHQETSVQHSATFPMDQNVFRPTVYNIPPSSERSCTHGTTLKLHRSTKWNLFKTSSNQCRFLCCFG